MRIPTLLAAGLVIAVSTAGAAHTPERPLLIGDWSGAQAHLLLTDNGGRLELGCAAVAIAAPVRPDAAGRFVASAGLEAFDGGPTSADVPPKLDRVRLIGQVDGDTIELSIDRDGSVASEAYTLRRGRQGKIIRCN